MASKKTQTTSPSEANGVPRAAVTEIPIPGRRQSAKKPAANKPAARTPTAKAPKAKSNEAALKAKKLSALDAAAKVLQESGQAMTCKQMIEAMTTQGYWTSPAGKTPEATLYSALLRELKTKGKQARFQKTQRGQFAYHSSQAS